MTAASNSEAITSAMRALPSRIRSEANIADRPGQLGRLELIATEVEALLVAASNSESAALATNSANRGASTSEAANGPQKATQRPAPVDSGAIGRLNEAERHEIEDAKSMPHIIRIVERILREHTDRALAEERDRWIARLAHLCDDVWLRNRDRAMDLPDSKTHGWMRRGSSVWEQAASAVRSVLNDLADYDDEYVDRHASYMTWLRNSRDRDELRAARQEQS